MNKDKLKCDFTFCGRTISADTVLVEICLMKLDGQLLNRYYCRARTLSDSSHSNHFHEMFRELLIESEDFLVFRFLKLHS